jgi:hypothetical protein
MTIELLSMLLLVDQALQECDDSEYRDVVEVIDEVRKLLVCLV